MPACRKAFRIGRMRRALALIISVITLSALSFIPAGGATNKPGTSCAKVGAKATYKSQKVTCVKVGTKSRWQLSANAKSSPSTSKSASPSASPTASPSSSSTTKRYTMVDVQSHSSPSSCWTVVNGNVYDVTTWIDEHPGGPARIKGLCGRDGTDSFRGQHGSRVDSYLKVYLIGVLTR